MSPLRVLGRIIALLLILLFILLTPALALAYNLQHALLGSDFPERMVTIGNLPEIILRQGATLLAEVVPQAAGNLPVAHLKVTDWEPVLRAAMPPEELQRWVRDGLGALQRWVREGGNFLDEIVIPLGRMRENVFRDPHQTLLRVLTEAQPACRGQEPLPYPEILIPRCRPEGDLTAFYRDLWRRWQQQPEEVWRQLWRIPLPDNLPLSDVVDLEVQARIREMGRGRPLYWIRLADRFLLPLLILQGVVLLLLVVLLAARNGAEALRWAGGPVALAGLFTLLLSLALLLAGPVLRLAHIPQEEMPQAVHQVLQEAVYLLAGEVWPPLTSLGGILLVAGLALWGGSFLIPGRPAERIRY
ncbi:MAG: hypothetical protein ACP5OO_12880 [Chloroflexia bacterium]